MANDRFKAPVAQLTRHRHALLVIAIGVAAFTFSAIDDRNARHRAGITDECAREQAADGIFPLHRCPSEEEVLAELARLGLDPPSIPTPDDPRLIDCEKLIAAERAGQPRTGPAELFWVLLGGDTASENSSEPR